MSRNHSSTKLLRQLECSEFSVFFSRRRTDLLHEYAHLVELLDDPLPINGSRLDDVVQLKDDEAITEVAIDTVDVW